MTRMRRTAGGQEFIHTEERSTVELSDVVYADDHDVLQPVEGWKDVKDNVNLILNTQVAWGTVPNLDKSSVMVHWKGAAEKSVESQATGWR